MRRVSCAVALAVLFAVSSGCYHHHLRANGDRVNSSYFRKTLRSPSEGKRNDFVVPPPLEAQSSAGLQSSADCKANGMYEVGITSYWKYAAGNVFSFGHWSRVKVEWLCAKQPPVIGPTGTGPRPAAANEAVHPAPSVSPRSPKAKQDELKKRTVHAFLMGSPATESLASSAFCFLQDSGKLQEHASGQGSRELWLFTHHRSHRGSVVSDASCLAMR